jgi:hypothetical protein
MSVVLVAADMPVLVAMLVVLALMQIVVAAVAIGTVILAEANREEKGVVGVTHAIRIQG